jgi:hypothetical protein
MGLRPAKFHEKPAEANKSGTQGEQKAGFFDPVIPSQKEEMDEKTGRIQDLQQRNASPFPEIRQSRSGLLRQEEVPRKRTRKREAGVGSPEDGPGDGESSGRRAVVIWTARAWLEIQHHRSAGDRRQ